MEKQTDVQFKTYRIIDNSGRFVLPADLRKKLNIEGGDVLIISLVDGEIRIKAIKPPPLLI